MIMALKYCH